MNRTGKTFVIGLSRTGTTSLHAAFVLLGIPSVHYPGRAARQWLRGDFQPDGLAEYDACSDMPTPVYFRDLDRRYPGSRFILTVRDVDRWLESVRELWETAGPSSQKTVLRDLIRVAMYGVTGFDREHLRDVFEAHIRNVREYFRERPGDLLEMDLTQGDGWDRLCPFLGLPIPEGLDFPRLRTPYIRPLGEVSRRDLTAKREAMLKRVDAG